MDTLAALYLRASTDKQDASIPQQAAELERYATAHGMLPVVVYYDDGISGTKSDRPGFQALIRDAEGEAPWEVVLIYDRSRWGRFDDILDSVYYESRLRHCGKRLVSMRESLDNTLAGNILRLVTDHQSKAEREAILTRLQRGRSHAVQLGYWPLGRAPYGYRLERVQDGRRQRPRLAIHDEEAETVRRIFRLHKEGLSLRRIAQALGDVPSPRGGTWSAQTLKQILDNPVYRGKVTMYGKRWGGSTVTATCPAIITGGEDYDGTNGIHSGGETAQEAEAREADQTELAATQV